MSNIIDSIQLSGVTYGIKGSGGTETIELTQAQYDALVDKDPNVFYIITDATAGDLTNYYTKTETNTLLGDKADTATTYTKTEVDEIETRLAAKINIKQGILTEGNGITIEEDVISVTGKVDTSTYNTYTAATDTALASKQTTLTAGTGISIVDNVISATGGGGGGKAISGGTNISITTGETADTINCTLPITAATTSSNRKSLTVFGTQNTISNDSSRANFIVGNNNKVGSAFDASFNNYIFGSDNSLDKGFGANHARDNFVAGNYNKFGENYGEAFSSCKIFGNYLKPKNNNEILFGQYNNSVSASTTFGDSGNTLFSVGNGTADNARHNAFEIRQNGDIYITLDGQDVKLQDQLGGGGGVNVVQTTGTSTTDVMSQNAVTNAFRNTNFVTTSYSSGMLDLLEKTPFNTSYNTIVRFGTINGMSVANTISKRPSFSLVETSAITSSVTSASTDVQVPSAKAVYDALQEGGGGGGMAEDDELLLSTALTDLNDRKIDASEVKANYQMKGDYVTTSTLNTRLAEYETALDEQNVEEVTAYALNDLNNRFGGLSLVKITESAYSALATKDENTLYIVVADPS